MDNINLNVNNKQKTDDVLEIALKGLSMRSKAVTGNISNMNTPGYKRRTVDFEETLMQQIQKSNSLSDIPLEKTDDNHFSNSIYEISELKDKMTMEISGEGSFTDDGNNVDIDREMIELTKTGLRFKAVAQMTKKHFELNRGIIRGG